MNKQIRKSSKYADYLTLQKKWSRTWGSPSRTRYKEEILGQKEFIEKNFGGFNKNIGILDCACGDGIGLEYFKSLGFKNVTGIDSHPLQIKRSAKIGFKIIEGDMHELTSNFQPSSFDIIYSAHTLEHAFSPDQVVRGFYNVLRLFGLLFVVLPYPDDLSNEHRKKIHCGSHELGLDVHDKGITLIDFFLNRGFALVSKSFASYKESVIWLKLEKVL